MNTMAKLKSNYMNIHSRAVYFINNTFNELEKYYNKNIIIEPNSELLFDKFRIKLTLKDDSIWDDYTLELQIIFPENYPNDIPLVYFILPPFHPNIDSKTGQIGLEMNKFKQENYFDLLLFCQSTIDLLKNPNLENNISNILAMKLFLSNRQQYERLVVQGKLNQESTFVSARSSVRNARRRKRNEISFLDYLLTWNGIATSKPNKDSENLYLNQIRNQTKLLSIHHGIDLHSAGSLIRQQEDKHNMYLYGNFAKKPQLSFNDGHNENYRIDKLRSKALEYQSNMKMIIHIKQSEKSSKHFIENNLFHNEDESADEAEMKDLMEWTENLKTCDI